MTATRTAFVLAGGGSLGAVQVGMLQALVAHCVSPDFVIGTSAGAINAVHFASYPTLEGVERLAGLWRGVGRFRGPASNSRTGASGTPDRRHHH